MSTIKSKEDLAYIVNNNDLIPLVDNAGNVSKAIVPDQIITASSSLIRSLSIGANVITVGAKGDYATLLEAVTEVLTKPQFVEFTGFSGTVAVAQYSNIVVGTGSDFDKITQGQFIEFNNDGKFYPIFRTTDELKLFMYVGVPIAIAALSTYKIYTRVDHVIKVMDNELHAQAINIVTLSGNTPVSMSIIGATKGIKTVWDNTTLIPRITPPEQGYFYMENIDITAHVDVPDVPDTLPLLGTNSPTNQELLYLELNNVELNAEVNSDFFGSPNGVNTALSVNVAAFVSNNVTINGNELTLNAAKISCDYAVINNPKVNITGGISHGGMLVISNSPDLLNHPIVINNPTGRAFPNSAGDPVDFGVYRVVAKSSITNPKQASITNPFIVYDSGVDGAGIRMESDFLNRMDGFVTGGFIKTNGVGTTSQKEHGDIIGDHTFLRVSGTITAGDVRKAGVAGGVVTFMSDVQEVKTAAYTMNSDDDIVICDGTFLVGLPQAPDSNGKRYTVKNIGTGTITVGITSDPNWTTDPTIDGATTKTLAQWESINVMQYYDSVASPNELHWVIV